MFLKNFGYRLKLPKEIRHHSENIKIFVQEWLRLYIPSSPFMKRLEQLVTTWG